MCDRCYVPGNCCRQIPINGIHAPDFDDAAEGRRYMTHRIQNSRDEHGRMHSMFEALRPYGDGSGVWLFRCTALRADGRCGDYENRPQLCRSYQAGQDGLCVHWTPLEAGDPTHDGPVESYVR